MADSIPIIAQLKSAIQAVAGNTEGARQTQENFSKTCPLISQLRAGVELALGKKEDAKETFGAGMTFIDTIPVVGHVKGVIHYAAGDKERGDAAMISSSRTTGVVAGSVVGFVVGGPVGAAAGGLAGGAVMDSVTTAVDSAVHKELRTHGIHHAAEQIVDDPKDGWKYVDLVLIPTTDACTGYVAGRGFAKIKGGAPMAKALKNVAKKPKQAGLVMKDVASDVIQLQERTARHESRLHGDIGGRDCEDDNVEEDIAKVAAVVRTVRIS